MSSLLQQLNDEMSRIVEKAHRSLVRVGSRRGGAGAGTIWNADGLIIIKKFFQGYGVFNA